MSNAKRPELTLWNYLKRKCAPLHDNNLTALRKEAGELNALANQQSDVLRIEKARADAAEAEVVSLRWQLAEAKREANGLAEQLYEAIRGGSR